MNTFFTIVIIFLIGGALTFASQAGNEKTTYREILEAGNYKTTIVKRKIDGTNCIILISNYNGNSSLSCDWSK